MAAYSPIILEKCRSLASAGRSGEKDARGRAVNFECGCFVEYSLGIDQKMKTVASSSFRSNGCCYMLAGADILAAIISGSELTGLHGLHTSELFANIEQELGPIPADRRECIVACTDAIRNAFADHRAREIEEFGGEKALICTCFGVAEQTIEHLIDSGRAITVDDVKTACRAGSGCGSCTMLIEEMLDAGHTR